MAATSAGSFQSTINVSVANSTSFSAAGTMPTSTNNLNLSSIGICQGNNINNSNSNINSGIITSQSNSNVMIESQQQQQHLTSAALQQNHQLFQQQQLQLQQQQLQHQFQYQQHSNISPQFQQHLRHQFIPRVGNVTQQNSTNAGIVGGILNHPPPNMVVRQINGVNSQANITSSSIPISLSGVTLIQNSMAGPSTSGLSQSIQKLNSMITRQSTTTTSTPIVTQTSTKQIINNTNNITANLAPGWRRLIKNNEVTYLSPSGSALRNQLQIKDYLLSPSTCKCGLPCPLKPEYFFDFNSQIPNLPLKIPLENGLPVKSSLLCIHQKRLFENQKNLLQKDVKRRKLNGDLIKTSSGGKISTTPITQCNSVAIYSEGNVMQTSQIFDGNSNGNVNQSVNISPKSSNNIEVCLDNNQHQNLNINIISDTQKEIASNSDSACGKNIQQLSDENCENKQIGTVTLSKTPPWRKTAAQKQSSENEQAQHSQKLNSVAPPWQQNELNLKNTTKISNSKSKPNFNDDPTGYLNQQTAILHNSIMNVVQDEDDEHRSTNQNEISQFTNDTLKFQRPGTIRKIFSNGQIISYQQHQLQQQQLQQQKKQNILAIQASSSNLTNNVPTSQSIKIQKISNNKSNILTSPNNNFVGQILNGVSIAENCDNNFNVPKQQNENIAVGINNKISIKNQEIQIQNILNNNKQQNIIIQAPKKQNITTDKNKKSGHIMVSASSSPQQSPSSSTRMTPPDIKLPQQVGAVSTSTNHNVSIIDSSPTSIAIKRSKPNIINTNQPISSKPQYLSQQTFSRNAITSVQAGKAITQTSTSNSLSMNNSTIASNKITIEAPSNPNTIISHTQKLSPNSLIPMQNLQLQSIVRGEPNNQLIMTSTGQIIVMPTSPTTSNVQQHQKPNQNQLLIQSPSNSGNNTIVVNQNKPQTSQQHIIINQQNANLEILNNHLQQNSNNLIISPNQNILQTSPAGNLITSTNQQRQQSHSNFIVNSSSNNNNVLLNNNLIQNGQNILQSSVGNSNIVQSGPKIISNQSIIPSQSNQLNTAGLLSPPIPQQTLVLNSLPSGGYVLQQPQQATIDGQMVSIQENGAFVQQQQQQQASQQQQQSQRHIIITSQQDPKRKPKKRKINTIPTQQTMTLSTHQQPTTITIQQPTTIQQTPQQQVVQITSQPHFQQQQHQQQQFQLSPGIHGIMLNKSNQANSQPQQILFQNGQILQPMNLIGQQLIVPASGLVMAPDSTLLQIQNMGMGGSIITTPQGMVLRTPSPQNKSFLSSNANGQQFIVNSNGQMSPIGQIYSPMSLVVPQSNGSSTTYVQNSATIVQQPQQQSQVIINQSPVTTTASVTISQDQLSRSSASPPDTTTHSPRSPERPPSHRSGGSDMVQFVSSSEPDSVVSPSNADSGQSPSSGEIDRSNSYHNVYKISHSKSRFLDTPPNQTNLEMKPDSHESPTKSTSPGNIAISTNVSQMSSTRTIASKRQKFSVNNSVNNFNMNLNGSLTNLPNVDDTTTLHSCSSRNFSVSDLVWGAARGHPAWPGKIVSPPQGFSSTIENGMLWVQWFGGRPNIELVQADTLKTLSEGLDAHHKAQKDTRKSRKLNSQLERAIHEAMTELDRMSTNQPPSSSISPSIPKPKKRQVNNNSNQSNASTTNNNQISSRIQYRTKPIPIAPAPSPTTITIQQQKKTLQTNENFNKITSHQERNQTSQ